MKAGLRGRMLAASGLLAAIVASIVAVLVVSIGHLRDSARLSHHSQQVIAASTELEKMVIDLETGQRGFVITGDPSFLQPWTAARRAIPTQEQNLERLVRDNPLQERRIQTLDRLISSYLEAYSIPLVRAVRAGRERARAIVATGEGKRRVDAMRALSDRFEETERGLAVHRDARTAAESRAATLAGAGGLLGCVLLVLLFAGYLIRAVVRPVRALAAAAGRLAGGDLSARVSASGGAEIGELAHSFNAMAVSLEGARDETESQNAELELQTAELEERQLELETVNDELQAQRGELERALEELGHEKERVEAFYVFSKALASPGNRVPFAARILRELCDFADAEVGTLYAISGQDQETLSLAAVRGVDPEGLPETLAPGQGLAGQALSENRVVSVSYGETGLRLPVFGEDVAVRHELHVPLRQDEAHVGVVTLARVADRSFSQEEREAIEHLAVQAAVGLSNHAAFAEARRLARVNKVVLDATNEGISLIDLEGRAIVRNEAILRIREAFGLEKGGTLFGQVDRIADQLVDPDAYRATMAAIATDPDREVVEEIELADSGRAFKFFTGPVRDDAGHFIGRIFTVREVTAEHHADRLKSELVATVSHELRTPLTGILGFAELLVKHDLDEGKRKRYLEMIYNEATRLTALVNDFLDLQRIESGQFALNLEPFDLGDVLRQEVALFAGQSAKHSIELSLDDEPLGVLGERERIAQVVGNLVSNAIKYSPTGGRVNVAASAKGGSVNVSVADSGFGIPADQREQLFTKFFRVDSTDTRKIGGTGLGLALCKEIVEAHGGRIGFDSVEGKGSTFWFELAAAQRRVGEPATGSRRRALVIEDDPVAAELLTEHLEASGLAVQSAATGEAGLELAAENPPAVVCLDIGLAGELDGWQVLAQLKASPDTAHVPVVVCTGGTDREMALALGATDFLTKPFSEELLREAIARALPAGEGSVLVADDEDSVRQLVVQTLGGSGFELREAADGEEALAAVAERKPDAIVLDLAMPGLDGFGVLEQLQGDPATRDIPVVVLTARSLTSEERKALQERAVSLLEKTEYSAHELRRLVGQALGR